MLIIWEWRHIKLLKRSGSGFDPGGVNTTTPGSLAIPCHACPIPNVNLPMGWENVPPERAWLYTLIVAMDVNFWLRSRLRGTIKKEPTLGLSWAYFVDNKPYSDFIKDHMDQEEIRTCVGFQALLNMLTKGSKGLRATGMAAWFTKFWDCAKQLPAALVPPVSMIIHALVPKFHLQSHIEACQSAFSFNFFKGGVRTDGEGVERNWDELNGQGPSTSEMLPCARWNTLDDCCGWVNWHKTMGLGNLLLKWLLVATTEAGKSRRDFTLFDSSLRKENLAEVVEMESNLAAWTDDHSSRPDPYCLPKSNVTLQQVRLSMAEEEKARTEAGTGSTHDVTASAFLLLGMDIEGLQQTLCLETSGKQKQTLLQKTLTMQQLYMPGFDPKTCSHVDRSSSSPPSHSIPTIANTAPMGWPQWKTVSAMRKPPIHLKVKSIIPVLVKPSTLRGNGPWEDVLKVLDHSDVQALNKRELTAQEKEDIRRVRERNGVILEADDINAERVLATVASVGEGHCRPSWIWYTGNVYEDMNDPLTRAALRVEWAKAKARVDWWQEEVILLDEEMRQVLEYCKWKEDWWIKQVPCRGDVSARLTEGLHAYAEEQADLERRIHSSWTTKWAIA
ncbi:hypothetical protein PILCRDRAFT_607 [Piloderma croceum F 1598]|uniref:CxC2-like cysteine cluster KDZ transposase-associated domain-containing protein n=1 Tax=Piloderma croceum (strain F 1598) TaxID=765440 RepID=A0A0C3GLE8_PILCF|nr:hypothetical protein PILCRDRAFT_607 [Piloderma croceum F 1598]